MDSINLTYYLHIHLNCRIGSMASYLIQVDIDLAAALLRETPTNFLTYATIVNPQQIRYVYHHL